MEEYGKREEDNDGARREMRRKDKEVEEEKEHGEKEAEQLCPQT